MSDPNSPREQETVDHILRLDELCDRFEDELKAGRQPVVAEFLRAAGIDPPAAPSELFAEFAQLEADYRARQTLTASPPPQEDPGRGPDAETTPHSVSAHPLPAVPGFEILEKLGEGGMGVVYKAIQQPLGRLVALKLLPPSACLDQRRRERFRREARSAARLHHTNIVPVFGVGEAGGQHYYAMQFIAGRSLDAVIGELRRLRGKPIAELSEAARGLATGSFAPPAPETDEAPGAPTATFTPAATPAAAGATEPARAPVASASELSRGGRGYWRSVARIVAQAAEALSYAHAQGVVHRDVKPANLLLDPHGSVWVTDFGLAKGDDDEGLTAAGDVLGTFRYMAPERFEGKGDHRADVYALGLTLYELLTLRPAFEAQTPEKLIERVLAGSFPAARSLDRSIPRDLETVLLKAAAKDPAARYQSAAELATDLKRFLEDRPVLARRSSAAERAWRWCRRNPAVATLLVGMLLSSLTGTAVATWYADSAEFRRRDAEAAKKGAQGERDEANVARSVAQKERREADEARKAAVDQKADADRARGEAVRSQRRAEWAAYVSQISLSQREWELGNAPAAFQILAATNPALRGWEYEYLQRLYTRDRKWQAKHAGGIGALAVSPDGTRVATVSHSELVISDAATGKVLFRSAARNRLPSAVAFSPDGKYVVTGDGGELANVAGRVERWEVASGRSLGELLSLPGGVRDLQFRNAAQIVATCADGKVYWVESATGRITKSIQMGSIRAAVSPDGRFLATAGWGQPIRLYDADTAELVRTVERPPTPDAKWPLFENFAFSPDSTRLAVGRRGSLYGWDVATGRNTLNTHGEGSIVTRIVWSQDGKAVITASEDRTVTVWDSETGQRQMRLLGHLAPTRALDLNADTLFSADSDGEVIAWNFNLPAEPQILRSPGQGWFNDIRFVPGGTTLLSVEGGSNEGRLWDLRTGRPTLALVGHTAAVTALAHGRGGAVAFTSSQDGTARMWDLKTGVCSQVFRGHAGPVNGVAAPPDGNWLVTAGNDATVRVWNAETGDPVTTLMTGAAPASRVATDPEGRLLAASFGDGQLVVWETTKWTEVARLRHGRGAPHSILPIAVSPDRQLLVSGGADRRLCVWDLASGKLLWEQETPASVLSIAFLPGGGHFVTGMGMWATPGEVKVWNTRSGENTFTLRGTPREIYGVATSPDGAVAACSHEGVIRVWGGRVPASAITADWHRTQWQQAEKKGDWNAAAFHLSRLALLPPEQPALALQAAHLWKLAGQPDRAALYGTWAYLQDPHLPASPERLAFVSGSGQWEVIGGEVAQSTQVRDHCRLWFGDPTWTDYDIEVEALRVKGGEGFGVAFRAVGPEDYMLANFGGWENRLAGGLLVQEGKHTMLPGSKPLAIEVGHWHRVRVEVRGDRFKVFLDGAELFAGRSDHSWGKVGLGSWDTVNRFRNIKVTAPDGRVLFEGLPHIVGAAPAPVARTVDHAARVGLIMHHLRLDPKDPSAHAALGQALQQSGDLAGAEVAFRAAVGLAPADLSAYRHLGRVLRDRKDFDGFVKLYEAGLKHLPQSAELHLSLGAVLCDQKRDYDGAIAHFEEVLRIDQRSAAAHHNLGIAWRHKGELAKSEAAFRRAIQLNDGYATAHYGLGVTLEAAGDLRGAAASYRAAATLKHSNASKKLNEVLKAERDAHTAPPPRPKP